MIGLLKENIKMESQSGRILQKERTNNLRTIEIFAEEELRENSMEV